MIGSTSCHVQAEREHDAFLSEVQRIRSLAYRRFSRLRPDQKEEAVAEAIAAGFVMFRSLQRRGRVNVAKQVSFARFAVQQVLSGRRVGGTQASCDALSVLGRRRHGRTIMPLEADTSEDAPAPRWLQEALDDRSTPIPDRVVAVRLDGSRWLESLPPRDRQMVRDLAAGHRPSQVACRFGLTPARVSQLRREWARHWQTYVGMSS